MSDGSPSDLLLSGVTGEGWLRWAAADLGALVEAQRRRMDLSPLSATVLGRALAGAALLQRFSGGGVDRVLLEIVGKGPIRTVVAEADAAGNVRGMVDDPRVATRTSARGDLVVGEGLGAGQLRVSRTRKGRVHVSQVELESGDVGEGLAHYLLQSEQTRSAVLVGVLVEPEGVVSAGGVMIEAFPGVPEETLERLEGRLAAFGSISRELAAAGLEGVLDSLLGGDRELHSAREIAYRCRCSRKRIRRYLEQLPPEDLRPPIEVTCAFCGETYTYRPEEVVPGELEPGQ